jgi:hypothetical protein
MMINEYFAKQDAKGTVVHLLSKADKWVSDMESNGLRDKFRSMWQAYHGNYYAGFSGSHQVGFSGEQGELVQLPVNHLRNLGQHILIMTTSSRPSMDARAINTDYKSLVQAKLANGILDYYMREKRLEKYLKTAVEYAIVMGSGFIKMEWNSTAGEIYDVIEETNTPVYEGDIEFSNLSPVDVIFDGTKENNNHDWVLTRSYKNKYDIAAKYPEFEEKIKGLPTKSDLEKFSVGVSTLQQETSDVPVYEFYHRKTESIPQGRYIMFLAEEVILQDVAMPYRMLPVYRIAPSDILGTPYGYTTLMDILPIQEAINSLYSTILTNQNAFGVQNIYVPRGADIAVSQLSGGLNVIEGNAQAGKPEALNLTSTPAEIFKFLEMLERSAETISGVNSVARGNSDSLGSNPSGAAMALIQSMALQFISGLQQSYVQLIEDVGTGIIKVLQDYAEAPRLIAIAGKTGRTFMKEFTSNDISNISRVYVDVGNPLGKSLAGRMQLAEQMMQYQLIKNPSQIVNLINTGNLDVLVEGTETELLLIRQENEKIIEGENPPVTVVDEHTTHIKEHKAVLADPDLRKDAALVMRATAHIQAHIEQLRTADPQLLQILNQPSLAPPPPPPGGPMGPPPMEQGQQGLNIAPGAGEVTGPGLPPGGVNVPTPPQVDPSLLANPEMAPPVV